MVVQYLINCMTYMAECNIHSNILVLKHGLSQCISNKTVYLSTSTVISSHRIYYISIKGRKQNSATQRNMFDWYNNMK